jgi:hypothetical protein
MHRWRRGDATFWVYVRTRHKWPLVLVGFLTRLIAIDPSLLNPPRKSCYRTLEFARLRYQDTERAHASTERLQALLLAGWVLRKFRIHQSEWCRCAEGVRAGDRGGASMLKQLESLISNSLQDLAPFQKEAWQTCLFDTCGHAGETQ